MEADGKPPLGAAAGFQWGSSSRRKETTPNRKRDGRGSKRLVAYLGGQTTASALPYRMALNIRVVPDKGGGGTQSLFAVAPTCKLGLGLKGH